jgi:N-hydroxyarylamine O-acetyltransferase
MDLVSYLERINYTGDLDISIKTLFGLHKSHVFNVPFENLDIHYKRTFTLDPTSVYQKVVSFKRGGFCYELNQLFNELLSGLGFNSRILAARVYDNSDPGPEYDHMAIMVQTDSTFLADVGFGDFFIHPIEIKTGIQSDGRNYFKIEPVDSESFDVFMSADGISFEKKYIFSLRQVIPSDFNESCIKKQTCPDSHFVRNTMCTLPTKSGRISIFNDKLIEKNAGVKTETLIHGDDDLRRLLKEKFQIEIT